jgi:creatinine amidohydrolase
VRNFSRLFILFLATLAMAPVPLGAAEIETARMTSAEITEAIKSGKTTILIPTGGVEQNGPHVVTGKHNTIVAETSRRIAKDLGDALVAPVVGYSPEGDIEKREGHMSVPGTVSLPPQVFEDVLAAVGESFAVHGSTFIVFIGDSGPNQEPQKNAARRLSEKYVKAGVAAMSADNYYANNGQQEWLMSDGETAQTIGTHAGIRDTSELLAIAPDGVRLPLLTKARSEQSGDPTRATAWRGEELIKLKVTAAVTEIRDARAKIRGKAPLSTSLWSRIKGWFSSL